MSGLAWLVSILMAATFMGEGASAPVYPLKPVLAAEVAPHIATTWDDRWIETARRQFRDKQPPARRSPLALLVLMGLVVIIWLQARQELKRERRAETRPRCRGPAPPFAQGGDLCYGLASRWGLR
jgi:hypothetical protein